MTQVFDILGLGCTSVDDLMYVDQYPAADTKTRVLVRERHCGGLTGTALVAAARLGSACSFAGTLGRDELSQFVLQRLESEGIDTAHARCRVEARPVHANIVVEESRGTRTIFFDVEGVFGPDGEWPAEELIRSAKVLFVDHFGIDGMIRAARVARAGGIAVVADFESDEHPRFGELLALVDHLVLSQGFAAKITGYDDPAVAVEALWTADRQAVVVTCGSEGAWYLGRGGSGEACRERAIPVDAVDTTGCGDVFHGAYASALARGLELVTRVRFASAAAALKATHRGGQAGIPDRAAVEEFMEHYRR